MDRHKQKIWINRPRNKLEKAQKVLISVKIFCKNYWRLIKQ